MAKQDETTLQEKEMDREGWSGTSLVPTGKLGRQKAEGSMIILPPLMF